MTAEMETRLREAVVRAVLLSAAQQVSGCDADLAQHLSDMANDYPAGPYTEESE